MARKVSAENEERVLIKETSLDLRWIEIADCVMITIGRRIHQKSFHCHLHFLVLSSKIVGCKWISDISGSLEDTQCPLSKAIESHCAKLTFVFKFRL